jgi:hypothetical protein
MSDYSHRSAEWLRAELSNLRDEKRRLEQANDEAYAAGKDNESGPYESNYGRMDNIDLEIRAIMNELDSR